MLRSRHRASVCRRVPARVVAAFAALFAAVAVAVAPAADGAAGVPLTKRDARRVADHASAATCRAVRWCTRSEVVPARRCRRDSPRMVYCAMAFITADGRRCGGVVGVSRAPTGRLDQVMAVPSDCSDGAGRAVAA
jgi:hypothetical protein